MTVFDIKKGKYRFINLMTLESLKISGEEYNITSNNNKKEINNDKKEGNVQ
tara:strand:- start:116 stop:268 length:153 start_codon:yes stop_codon:yes gene_type:complete